ncbi:AAA family ATPase [Pararhizobium sp.]|uniref:AAA family ATPase n=1 Tax=Pararhizobium sp. TaxID=1977563 RepID=UPI0027183F99|nr:AAA family ATPase [Pararhizobium sp.]MDO9418445.1 adenylate/guanylate cyclase domain-containing protein [Pararhizobium sp.]
MPDLNGDCALRERRQVTVLFADIVGYTDLAVRLDPEDLRDLLQNYYALSRRAIEASGGVVAEYLADGIVAHFGTPLAYPDAADRAVEAARLIIRETGEIVSAEAALRVRIGMATGLVVAEFDGTISRITGAASVLAARLQASAEAGSVYMSDLTRRLLQRGTGVRFIGDLSLKGFSEPEPVWSLDCAGKRQMAGEGCAFFGRDDELRRLSRAWHGVLQTGRASPLVILSGRPGIGKSRLLREHGLRCPAGQETIILQASERQGGTACYPVVEWLKREARISIRTEDTGYLHALCQPETAAALHLREAPPAIRQGTFDAILETLRTIAEAGPIQIVIEDLQWLDHSTCQLVAMLLTGLQAYPIQWLASCRPEFGTHIGGLGGSVLTIGELDLADCRAAVASCCGEGISPALVDMIIARSEGVPLFLEHLVRELNEGRFSGQTAVPETLVGTLSAWIDSTGSARRVAQGAAVIGRNFDAAMLADILASTPEDVGTDIERLCRAEIFERDNGSGLSFRHDLIREAAYSTLLRQRRTGLHRRVAWAHAKTNPPMGDKVMAEIAYHHEAAGDHAVAADYRYKIGRHATAFGAFAEGENQLRRAIGLLAAAARTGENIEHQQANLLVDLAANLMQTRGFTDPEVLETYTKSLAHLQTIDQVDRDRLPAFWGLFTYQVLIGHMKEARTTVSTMETLFHRLPKTQKTGEHLLCVLGTRNAIQFYSGRFQDQLATVDQIKTHYEFERHAPLAAKYGMDLLATAQAFSPHSAAITGQFDRARSLVAEADALQEMLSIPLMRPFIDIWGGVALAYLGDFELASARLERGISLADRQGAAFWSATGRMWQAITEFDLSGNAAERARMEDALAVQARIGVGIGIPYWSAKLAAAYAVAGNDHKAQELAYAALRGSPGTGEGTWRAERHRLCGFVHECAGRGGKALSAYRIAARTAFTQSAALWEMRARQAIQRLEPSDDVNMQRLNFLLKTVAANEGPQTEKNSGDKHGLLDPV